MSPILKNYTNQTLICFSTETNVPTQSQSRSEIECNDDTETLSEQEDDSYTGYVRVYNTTHYSAIYLYTFHNFFNAENQDLPHTKNNVLPPT